MRNSKKNSPVTKIVSKKALNFNKVALRSFKFYKKTIGIIDRTNIALGRKIVFISSDSFIEPVDEIEEQVVSSEFATLKEDIGEELFNSLSEEDKQFILSTEGSVDLGYDVGKNDLKRIFSSIKNDYQY